MLNRVFELLILILLGGVSLLAFFSSLLLLLPKPVARTQAVLNRQGGKSILLGFFNFAFFGLIVGGCIWVAERAGGLVAGIFIFIGGALLLALVALTVIGLVALANLLSERIDNELSPFKHILRGGTILILAGLAPYIGWFIFTPLAVWAGLGAAIQALLSRKNMTPAET
ncbi:MAG: hypothetical protein Kow002_00380 [Anaerolineales bacterium]